MRAGKWIAVQSVASRKAGHDPRPLAASTTTNMGNVASARTRRAARLYVTGGVHRARGGMGRRSRSASLYFSRCAISELTEARS